jgi:glucose/arabinose dehydrogenase
MRIVALSLALVVVAGSPAAAQSVTPSSLQVELVAPGLSQPTSMAFIGPRDILVLEKATGKVRRVSFGVLYTDPALDVPVHFLSERGLLGIAVDPDFPANRYVYIYYTESSTGTDTSGSSVPLGNRLYRYTYTDGALIDPVLILDLPVTPGPNHNGGVLTFGPDGALYLVIGELNRNGRLQNFPTGPPPDDTGVIFRVDTQGQGLADNPFYNDALPSDPMNRYFAYGIRNSFGLAFDPVSGDLWDTENGPGLYDEVNRVTPGFNSGWEQIMGPDARDQQGIGDLWHAPGSQYSDPEFSWFDTVAPTGLAFAASPIFGCGFVNDLFVGDNNCGQIYRFQPNAARDGLSFASPGLQDLVADNTASQCSWEMNEIIFGTGFGVITDIENGPDGSLYVVSLSHGAIYRIAPRPGGIIDTDGDGAGAECDCAPTDRRAFAPPVEVPRLRVMSSAPLTWGWDTQAAIAGPGTTTTIVTGDLDALRASGGYGSACTLARGLGTTLFYDRLPDPPTGSGSYFLVRDENPCGTGTFGDGTGVPDPRDALDTTPPADCFCSALTGGALITFEIAGDSLTVWVTEDNFIDNAKYLLTVGNLWLPIFSTLLDGRACDTQWTWQVDPQNVAFGTAAPEVCDGLPSHIEADKTYWLETLGHYCPWSAVVTAVDDRR